LDSRLSTIASGGGVVVFDDLYPKREGGLNARHLLISDPTRCHPGHKAARGPKHQRITLHSVRRTHQWRETIRHKGKISVRPVAIDARSVLYAVSFLSLPAVEDSLHERAVEPGWIDE
jgi:hypothetical protein